MLFRSPNEARSYVSCVALLGALWLAASADAQQVYTMSGVYGVNRSLVDERPLIGDTPCPQLVYGRSFYGMTHPVPPSNVGPANPLGCVPGAAQPVVTGGTGVGGAVALPVSFFSQPADGAHTVYFPLGFRSQLATSFSIMGPAAASAVFQADDWTMQSGRAAADFTWCPEVGACTSAGAGPRAAVVRYIAGPRRFGGTMGLLMNSGPVPPSFLHEAGAGVRVSVPPSTGVRPTGLGYASPVIDVMKSGQLWAGRSTSSMGRVTPTNYLGATPGASRFHTGFPFTTGTVILRYSKTLAGNYSPRTETAMGIDESTSMGARNISLVAGGLTFLAPTGTSPSSLNLAQISLPEPRRGVSQLIAALLLASIATWRGRVARAGGGAIAPRTPTRFTVR